MSKSVRQKEARKDGTRIVTVGTGAKNLVRFTLTLSPGDSDFTDRETLRASRFAVWL